jgi:vesicle coat complex subunit
LTTLTSNPVAIKAAAGKFIELCIKVSDNNVKLIVLDKVDQLRKKNQGVLDDLVMEVLRVLSRYFELTNNDMDKMDVFNTHTCLVPISMCEEKSWILRWI